jgi:hypothetical protein
VLGDCDPEHHHDDRDEPQSPPRHSSPTRLERKTPRFRTGLFGLTALGFSAPGRQPFPNLKLKTQKATAPR